MRRLALLVGGLLAAGCEGYLQVDSLAATRGDGGAVASECDPFDLAVPDGHHNPGLDCLPCHDGTIATAFTTGGTLFDDLAGTAPVVGATIHVIDADGKDVVMRSAANGNFWTTEPIAYPITTYASGCPDEIHMVTDVPSPVGCSAASCHVQGFRVHLP